jgi:transcriptional regulator with XRE-family HTH domain
VHFPKFDFMPDDPSPKKQTPRTGAYIRQLRKQTGLSLRAAGQLLGISYVYLQQLETGTRPLTLHKLKRLVPELGGDLEEAVRLYRLDVGV